MSDSHDYTTARFLCRSIRSEILQTPFQSKCENFMNLFFCHYLLTFTHTISITFDLFLLCADSVCFQNCDSDTFSKTQLTKKKCEIEHGRKSWKTAVLLSPRVMPLGHSMLSATSTCRSTPFIPAFSILALVPQSDQYIKLGWTKKAYLLCYYGELKMISAALHSKTCENNNVIVHTYYSYI